MHFYAQVNKAFNSPFVNDITAVFVRCAAKYIYSRLSLSRNPRDSTKHFEISVLRHIRFAELRKQLIE